LAVGASSPVVSDAARPGRVLDRGDRIGMVGKRGVVLRDQLTEPRVGAAGDGSRDVSDHGMSSLTDGDG
jgi:hypothetical protein